MSEPVTAVLTRPDPSVSAAAAILRRHWGLEGDLRSLPSERDRNFLVSDEGQPRWVLKLSNLAEDPAFLELQHLAQDRLIGARVVCPHPVQASDGRLIVPTSEDDGPPFARVFAWVPGVPLSGVPPAARAVTLLHDVGRTMGTVAAALRDLEHPAAHRVFQWDTLRGDAVMKAHASAVSDPKRQRLLDAVRARLASSLWPHMEDLPRSVIHNDANDDNVLVEPPQQRVSGLLDFGDMIHSVTANELAVACAYSMLGAADPLAVAAAITAGFRESYVLDDAELRVVPELAIARLATSLSLSAHQARLDPADAYLTVTEAPAGDLLARLVAIPPSAAAKRILGRAA